MWPVNGEDLMYLFQRDTHLVLHRFDAEMQQLSHFLIFESILLYQLEYQATLRRQFIDGPMDPLQRLTGDYQVFRGGVKMVQREGRVIQRKEFFMPVLAEIAAGA